MSKPKEDSSQLTEAADSAVDTNPRNKLMFYALQWFELQQVKKDDEGILRDPAGEVVQLSELKKKFKIDLAYLKNKKLGATAETISDLFELTVGELERRRQKELRDKLEYDPSLVRSGYAELKIWLQCVTGNLAIPDQDIAVMQHFLWQSKRKLFGKPVSFHMMPVFSGIQESGKSVAIEKRLLAPIKHAMITGQGVDYIVDSRNYLALSNNYIAFFDEMAKAATTDVEKLKQIITATTLTYRPLYSHQSDVVMQNCTFIGCSNKDLRDLVYDTTGARRFYQIEVLTEFSKNGKLVEQSWVTINTVDVMAIWKSIDENQDEPYIMPFRDGIKGVQAEFRQKTSIEEWLEETNTVSGTDPKPGKELYNEYKAFCVANGRKDQFARNAFTRILKKFGIDVRRSMRGRDYLIDAEVRIEANDIGESRKSYIQGGNA